MELIVFLFLWPFRIIAQDLRGLVAVLLIGGGLIALLPWDRVRYGRRRVVVKRLDQCPGCGSRAIRREAVGGDWQIWCGECRRLWLAVLTGEAGRRGGGSARTEA